MQTNVVDFHGIDFSIREYISIRLFSHLWQVRSREPIPPDAFRLRGLVVLQKNVSR
jgi:hypothetical protein